MKKNLSSNKQLLSALTIGISAMLALQTPITAYANTDVDTGDAENTEPEDNIQVSVEDENTYFSNIFIIFNYFHYGNYYYQIFT